MKKERILEHCDFLPAPNAFFPGVSRVSRAQLRARALSEPGFGYLVARTFADKHNLLPVQVTDDAIVRLHRRMLHDDNNNQDQALDFALMLAEPDQAHTAEILQALLIAEDISFFELGTLLGCETESIFLYHELFFNVRDRRNEPIYISAVVNGTGDPGGPRTYRSQLLQAARSCGAKAVMELAGLQRDSKQAGHDARRLRANLEETILKMGLRNLALGDGAHPSVRHGVQLVQASKRVDAGSETSDDLTAMSMRTPILDTLDRLVGQGSEEFAERQAAAGQVFGKNGAPKEETKAIADAPKPEN